MLEAFLIATVAGSSAQGIQAQDANRPRCGQRRGRSAVAGRDNAPARTMTRPGWSGGVRGCLVDRRRRA